MAPSPQDLTATLVTLQARWGAAAPRVLGQGDPGAVFGALATVPLPDASPNPVPQAPGRAVSTGFAALDAILGPGGLPRTASVALRGAPSSGATTLALRIAAEAQAAGLIVAWLDLARSFDPVEACARGVAPEWLVVVTPESLDEGLSIGGSLLAGRSVDLLVVDLPPGRVATRSSRMGTDPPGPASSGGRPPGGARRPGVAERLGRLAALARRAGSLFIALEPPGLDAGLASAVGDATGVRLELSRRSWIHLGRDVVGQRTAVTVGRNRYGPEGRSADIRILYADGGERDACLQREGLLREGRHAASGGRSGPPGAARPASPALLPSSASAPGIGSHAPAAPLLATSPAGSRRAPLRLVPTGPGRRRRPALDGRPRPGREPRGAGAGRPAGDGARVGPPART